MLIVRFFLQGNSAVGESGSDAPDYPIVSSIAVSPSPMDKSTKAQLQAMERKIEKQTWVWQESVRDEAERRNCGHLTTELKIYTSFWMSQITDQEGWEAY